MCVRAFVSECARSCMHVFVRAYNYACVRAFAWVRACVCVCVRYMCSCVCVRV